VGRKRFKGQRKEFWAVCKKGPSCQGKGGNKLGQGRGSVRLEKANNRTRTTREKGFDLLGTGLKEDREKNKERTGRTMVSAWCDRGKTIRERKNGAGLGENGDKKRKATSLGGRPWKHKEGARGEVSKGNTSLLNKMSGTKQC